MAFDPIFPDVLGAVTDGKRYTIAGLQYGVGIFPRQAFINQLVEVVVLLQNTVGQDMPVRVTVRTAYRDKRGQPVRFVVADHSEIVRLGPAEVGVLHIPLAAMPPTKPGRDIPILVQVESRPPRSTTFVRPPDGGPPPSAYAISSHKLSVLRDVHFADPLEVPVTSDGVVVKLDVAAKQLPGSLGDVKARYEALWRRDLVEKEREQAAANVEKAYQIVMRLFEKTIYWDMIEATEDRYAIAGLPLHPGEAKAIARMMVYTVEDAPSQEATYDLQNARWFKALCQFLAHNPDAEHMDRGILFSHHLYDAVLHDAIHVGFRVVQSYTREDLGNQRERHAYANKVLEWINGVGAADVNYAYLPLAMGGVLVNPLVRLSQEENPWIVVQQFRQAYQGRHKLLQGDAIIVFKVAADLLEKAIRDLKQRRVPKPEA